MMARSIFLPCSTTRLPEALLDMFLFILYYYLFFFLFPFFLLGKHFALSDLGVVWIAFCFWKDHSGRSFCFIHKRFAWHGARGEGRLDWNFSLLSCMAETRNRFWENFA